MTITTPTVEQLLAAFKAKGYVVFENDTKNYNLNLFGIRAATNVPNKFDDLMGMFWKHKAAWTIRTFPATTDPGLYYLLNPLSKLGTGILPEGQYRGFWKIGKHQGKYAALVQAKPVEVIRDFDRDAVLDFDSARREYGMFGINGHRAAENGKSVDVNNWSALCQVLQNREIRHPDNQSVKVFEFDYFMGLCYKAAEAFGNSFTYTLLNEKQFM